MSESTYRRRRKVGLCAGCGKVNSIKSLCDKCSAKNKSNSRISYLKHRDKRTAYSRKWAREHKEKRRETRKIWYAKTREARRLYQRNWVAKRDRNELRRRAKSNHLLRSYGITVEQFELLEREQGGKCFICGRKPEHKHGRLFPDHCHITGRLRRLLCPRCNNLLGLVSDNPDILRRAASYLESYSGDSRNQKSSITEMGTTAASDSLPVC